jgi:mono/diheme cytochrome c family protein
MRFVAPLNIFFSFLILTFNLSSLATEIEPDWSANATIDPIVFPNGRANIYQWDEKSLIEKIEKGKKHALHYPVVPTGILLPARPMLKILSAKPGEPLFFFMKSILSLSDEFTNFNGFWDWLGLTPPDPQSGETYPMGVSVIHRDGAEGFTLSCAACHSSNLFGKPVFGMSNRFPRANLFFKHGQEVLERTNPTVFAMLTSSNSSEKKMIVDAKDHVVSVGIKKPATLGLDTSLAQVVMSLAKRAPTENAERTPYDAAHPRATIFDSIVSDSKPAVWWNVKYKTRWLSDGSILSGNPIFTNFLWNEIGRGVDLPELLDWLSQNKDVVQELTTAVFATEPPKWKDFIGEHRIDLIRAKRGGFIYAQACSNCHGEYTKGWDLSSSQWETLVQESLNQGKPAPLLIDTIRLNYSEKVKDVGTDDGRRRGMQALAQYLNPLQFSKNFGIVIEEQKGYVPPPLDGIWARFPYFHNNSIPSLCALMTPPAQRPVVYVSGKALDPERDYDQECLGYPEMERIPSEWKKDPEHVYDTRLPGMSNQGHYERIFTKDGTERFTAEEKKDLIEFLKTL